MVHCVHFFFLLAAGVSALCLFGCSSKPCEGDSLDDAAECIRCGLENLEGCTKDAALDNDCIIDKCGEPSS